jgi:predicted lipoprotein with Yx(FWY)xxD motif
MTRRWFVLLLLVALVAAGCGGEPAAEPTAPPADAGDATETVMAPSTTAPPMETATSEPMGTAGTAGATAAAGETTVATTTSDLGEILVDGEGRTLYAFLNDAQGAPTCADDCAQNWPPLPGPATAGEGVDGALLSTAERDDGSMQVTYNDWPLYHFAGDAAPGDTNGQGVGDVWYVVDAAGEPVDADGS